MPRPNRAELKGNLRIDEDDIDRSLIDQAQYFSDVADETVEANSIRDTLKLELSELLAELDQSVRQELITREEKFTETSLSNKIKTLPRVRELQRKLLDANKRSDSWGVLKESYQQRGYALRELNSSQISKLQNLGLERGAGSARARVGERVRERAEQERREARTERFRPTNVGD